jgi:hypothetical protein
MSPTILTIYSKVTPDSLDSCHRVAGARRAGPLPGGNDRFVSPTGGDVRDSMSANAEGDPLATNARQAAGRQPR